MGDSQVLQISQSPLSNLTLPTLPIPPSVKSISAARLGAPSTGKGKGRAMDDDDDDEVRDPAKGSIIESQGSFINVLSTFKNIAPIFDAVLVDTDGSGQVRGLSELESLNYIDFLDFSLAPNRNLFWGR
jgi:DNA damage-binding protein 1